MAVPEQGVFDDRQSIAEIWQLCQAEVGRAIQDRKHPFRFVSLATASPQTIGLRTLVLRKYDQAGHLWLYTDLRTAKIQQLRQRPQAALLMYHPRKQLQLSWQVSVQLHHENETAQELWAAIPDYARKDYLALATPGSKLETANPQAQLPADDSTNFVALELIPTEVEALQLRREGHLRFRWQNVAGEWQGSRIAP
jgi:pyridoxine/pyridoxamine 5'-phosphate oxidase